MAPHAHPTAVACAEALVKRAGDPFTKCFFSDDGSTAVETGLKMALQYFHNRGDRKRRRFLSIANGYHGDTLGAVGVGFVDEYHAWLDKSVQPSIKATQPYCYRCPIGKTYPECEIACLDETEKFLAREGESVAALVVEPLLMGAAGMVVYPKEYLIRLVEKARAAGALILFDEVFTGFGRTGSFFAFERLPVKPDLLALSKGLTSGMLPMGATLATSQVYEAFKGGEDKKFFHGHTFSGNGLGCAVALESLKLFEENQVLEKNKKLIALMARETARFRQLPSVGDVRQLGMVWALELVQDKESKRVPVPPAGPGWKVAERLWEKGVWLRPLHNTLYVIPPYCSTEGDLRTVFDLMYEELQDEHLFS